MIVSKKEKAKAADEQIAKILEKIGDSNGTKGSEPLMVNRKFSN